MGEERKRYEVPGKYLSLPAFQELIVQSEADELEPKIQVKDFGAYRWLTMVES